MQQDTSKLNNIQVVLHKLSAETASICIDCEARGNVSWSVCYCLLPQLGCLVVPWNTSLQSHTPPSLAKSNPCFQYKALLFIAWEQFIEQCATVIGQSGQNTSPFWIYSMLKSHSFRACMMALHWYNPEQSITLSGVHFLWTWGW